MIGIWSDHTATFLCVLGWLVALGAGVPIAFFPRFWARRLGWDVSGDLHLVHYLARCLGGFILALSWLMIRAAALPQTIPIVFEFMLILWTVMLLIHVWGALTRAQPLVETLEIGVWLVVIGLTLAFWPVSAGLAG